ncbi:MAG: S-layer homology domain-containing protein [Hyellaceae cyanobacterium CSU_1_1]|nr:S-layer homology domain-containing protein [Hyellaceae cyanobacterium CSU_1_1]
MTNSSPPESPNPIPERRRRPATGLTFDEMIAIIVAFSTIGTILLWAIGGRNNKLAGNLGLNGNSSLLASDQGNDTSFGFGNILSQDTNTDASVREQKLEAENRQLAARLREQDAPVVYIPPNKTVNLPAKAERKSISLDSGGKLVPLAGVATLPGLRNKPGDRPPTKAENNVETEPPIGMSEKVKPEAEVVPIPAPVQQPPAIAPATKMPQDVAVDYWAYPFIKQIRDRGLVSEIAKNQELEPNALITRASMATLVSQAFDKQPETQAIKKFNDVSNKNELAKDIDKAVRTGFMQGYSNNEFKPLENIPRYQVLVTLATGLGLQPSQDADQILQQFGDLAQMPDWAKQQVAAATEAGLVVNPPDLDKGSLAPERSATRGEVVAMIHQALVKTGRLKPLESEYIVKP